MELVLRTSNSAALSFYHVISGLPDVASWVDKVSKVSPDKMPCKAVWLVIDDVEDACFELSQLVMALEDSKDKCFKNMIKKAKDAMGEDSWIKEDKPAPAPAKPDHSGLSKVLKAAPTKEDALKAAFGSKDTKAATKVLKDVVKSQKAKAQPVYNEDEGYMSAGTPDQWIKFDIVECEGCQKTCYDHETILKGGTEKAYKKLGRFFEILPPYATLRVDIDVPATLCHDCHKKAEGVSEEERDAPSEPEIAKAESSLTRHEARHVAAACVAQLFKNPELLKRDLEACEELTRMLAVKLDDAKAFDMQVALDVEDAQVSLGSVMTGLKKALASLADADKLRQAQEEAKAIEEAQPLEGSVSLAIIWRESEENGKKRYTSPDFPGWAITERQNGRFCVYDKSGKRVGVVCQKLDSAKHIVYDEAPEIDFKEKQEAENMPTFQCFFCQEHKPESQAQQFDDKNPGSMACPSCWTPEPAPTTDAPIIDAAGDPIDEESAKKRFAATIVLKAGAELGNLRDPYITEDGKEKLLSSGQEDKLAHIMKLMAELEADIIS